MGSFERVEVYGRPNGCAGSVLDRLDAEADLIPRPSAASDMSEDDHADDEVLAHGEGASIPSSNWRGFDSTTLPGGAPPARRSQTARIAASILMNKGERPDGPPRLKRQPSRKHVGFTGIRLTAGPQDSTSRMEGFKAFLESTLKIRAAGLVGRTVRRRRAALVWGTLACGSFLLLVTLPAPPPSLAPPPPPSPPSTFVFRVHPSLTNPPSHLAPPPVFTPPPPVPIASTLSPPPPPPLLSEGHSPDSNETRFEYPMLPAEEAAAPEVTAIPTHLIRVMQAAAKEDEDRADLAERRAHSQLQVSAPGL